jgi:membrane-associated phospholipid phosphatase
MMFRGSLVLPFLGFVSLAAAPARASDRAWSNASTIGRDVLMAAALAVPAVQGDWAGDLEAAGSIGAAELVSYGFKEAFPERRPDGSDRKSFPSGHVSISFAAAATMHQRYGWEVGLPATALASFVALARVKAEKHHWYDAAAGAAIGEASGFLVTSPRNESVRVLPWGDTKGGGIAVALRF